MKTINTAFREALIKSVEGKRNLGRFGSQVNQSLRKEIGLKHSDVWNSRLKPMTAAFLKEDGIIN